MRDNPQQPEIVRGFGGALAIGIIIALCWDMTNKTQSSASGILITAVLITLGNGCIAEPVGSEQGELSAKDCTVGEVGYCDFSDFREGSRECEAQDDGSSAWGECAPLDQGPEDCSEGSTWTGSCCVNAAHCCDDALECNTPLVLSFDGRRVTYTSEVKNSFDLSGRGMSHGSDWPTAGTPWLVLDRNANGQIDDGGELFGSASRLSSGATAANGFAALSEFDQNSDGRITEADGVWSQLQLWSDRDASRRSSKAELSGLDAHGIIAIELDYSLSRLCDARLNCESERARFVFRNAKGELKHGTVIDIHLPTRLGA